ncbi:MAG: hypothetical protein AVDCRST_MAG20-302, partial [uncultured Acidimicrobiales bacterium]
WTSAPPPTWPARSPGPRARWGRTASCPGT